MKNLIEVNKDIQSHKNANDYPKLIKTHGYVFYPILSIDRLRFFASEGKQIVIDFKNRVAYKCENYSIVSIGHTIDREKYSEIVSYCNNDMKIEQSIRIQIIIDMVFGLFN